MFKQLLISGLLGAAAVLPMAAHAQSLHEGDIELAVESGKIVVEGAAAFHGLTGASIFEGDFGDLAGGPYRTDDPGFDSEDGAFGAGTLLQYQAVGNLQFWNGSAWSAAVPLGEYVRLDGNLGEESRWTVGGIAGDASGLIGQAGATGKVHEHLDIRVARDTAGAPSVGAYLIQLQVQAEGYATSDPFFVVFNRGLAAPAFEGALQALTTPVPEPGTWALMVTGLAVVGAAARRRMG